MPKKGYLPLILTASAFICIMMGVFIGRQTSNNIYHITDTSLSAYEVASDISTDLQNRGKWNINTATAIELAELPGIGAVIAQRIVDYRTANGPFESIEALSNVEGIGEKRIDAIYEFVTTGG